MENYVANVIPHLQQWWPVIIVLAYLVGIGFAMVSLAQSVSHKHRFNRSTAVWTLWAAVLLLNIPALMHAGHHSRACAASSWSIRAGRTPAPWNI